MPKYNPNSPGFEGLDRIQRLEKHAADSPTLTPASSLDNVTQAQSAGVVPTVVKAVSGQTADLLQFQDSTGATLLSVTAGGGIGGSGASAINVRSYGAKGDGTTDDTDAVQAALDASSSASPTRAVFFPAGTYLVDTLTYKGQSLRGEGMLISVIQGKPSQDVFHADPSVDSGTVRNIRLEDFSVVVDDSTDASSDFPDRGGVGNACFAFDFADGSAYSGDAPFHWDLSSLSRIKVASLSATDGGKNNSCGFYLQIPINRTVVDDIYCYRLAYGWWDDYPTSNLTSVEIGSDHNDFRKLYFNGCNQAFRGVNEANCLFGDITFHSCPTAFSAIGAVTLNRSEPSNLQFATVMIESATTQPWKLEGINHKVDNLYLSAGAEPSFASSDSLYEVVTLGSSGGGSAPVMQITGNRNEFKYVTCAADGTTAYARDLVDDQGLGNRVVLASVSGGSEVSNKKPRVLTADGRRLHNRDAGSLLLGHVGANSGEPFVSSNDLLVSPYQLAPVALTEGTGYTHTVDSTTDLNCRLHLAAPAGYQFTRDKLNGEYGLVVGKFLPAGRVRVYVKAKSSASVTQFTKMQADAAGGTTWSDIGGATLSWTTSYAVQWFDVDLSGLTSVAALRMLANNLSDSLQSLDIAWIMFRPFAADALVAGSIRQAISKPTYGTSVAIDASVGPWKTITVTDTVAFTIAAPTNPPDSTQTTEFTVEVLNSSGGSMGTITWNSAFVFNGFSWSNPASTKKRWARFRWNGAKWICQGVAGADY